MSGNDSAGTILRPPVLELKATSFNLEQLICPDSPQIAMAGRSNVGKSSLINALAGRKKLAKISSTPGKTRSINYYQIQGTESFMVDLPGYGYAKCSQEERNKWAKLLEYYFQNTSGLAALVLLLDSRLEPQKSDKEMAAFALSLRLPLIPVLTKTDKCSAKEIKKCRNAWGAFIFEADLIETSSQSKKGLPELWEKMAAFIL